MKESVMKTFDMLNNVAGSNGLNLLKGTINGFGFISPFEFRIFFFFLCLGPEVEVSREKIVQECYVPNRKRPNYRINPRSVDVNISRINKVLEKAGFVYRLRNFGSPKKPRGVMLTARF